MASEQLSLKPGDLVVALKLVLCPGDRYESLAEALGMSLSVTHRAVRRLEQARLLILGKRNANRPGLLEFLVYGSPYAFPAHLGPQVRGVPTAGALADFQSELPGESSAVWPHIKGELRGPSLRPLHAGVPEAALRDHRLHRMLALTDLLRIGQARERQIAKRLLETELKAS
jgi:hypothetical protein